MNLHLLRKKAIPPTTIYIALGGTQLYTELTTSSQHWGCLLSTKHMSAMPTGSQGDELAHRETEAIMKDWPTVTDITVENGFSLMLNTAPSQSFSSSVPKMLFKSIQGEGQMDSP